MDDTQRILVVDDEAMVREVVSRYLTDAGYEVETLSDGDSARRTLASSPPDLVVLDVMLPGQDGLSLLRQLRSRSVDVPVILLTARSDEVDRIQGLDIGADDYVVKPFSPRELVARVRSVLRRTGDPTPAEPLEFDGLSINPATREVRAGGEQVELTRREFDLLFHLASHPRQVFSRAHLLQSVWDSSPDWQDPSTVTVHVRRLRSKIEPDPDEPRWIVTVWGVGYRFEP
ncbi:MAG: response regulator transcription factor [Nitriliruptorales bacterium]|nr:response regulator transcription factor [Nitriliruptorales bacterium]